jgi:hypothetical protein
VYTPLGQQNLKSGETLEVGVVLGPDPEWLPRLVPFLGHKTPDFRAHIEGALGGALDGLQTRFYVGSVHGRLISQIMIVGDGTVGILGHVYTMPEERRKGACAAIMQHQMADCRREGFRVLGLGTGFETPPYWIYHSFGFRSIAAGSGRMKWLAAPVAEAELFRSAPVSVRALRWEDWPWFELLGFLPVAPDEELPRCLTLGTQGQDSLEGPFVSFQARRAREPQIDARVLVSQAGATVGWALLGPDTRWFRRVWLLDLYAHPSFTWHLSDLLAALEWPQDPVTSYTTVAEGPKAAALRTAGFHRAATLEGWLFDGEERRDVIVWQR